MATETGPLQLYIANDEVGEPAMATVLDGAAVLAVNKTAPDPEARGFIFTTTPVHYLDSELQDIADATVDLAEQCDANGYTLVLREGCVMTRLGR